MNKIEKMFFDAWCDMGEEISSIEPGAVVGPYKIDFLIYKNAVIEIDGHDTHKTKEQRDYDYKRERYLQKEGYIVIRFMGTEVFLSAKQCAEEAMRIACLFNEKIVDAFEKGVEFEKARD